VLLRDHGLIELCGCSAFDVRIQICPKMTPYRASKTSGQDHAKSWPNYLTSETYTLMPPLPGPAWTPNPASTVACKRRSPCRLRHLVLPRGAWEIHAALAHQLALGPKRPAGSLGHMVP